MTMASGIYVATIRDAFKNVIALDLDAGTDKCALYTTSLTPNFDADPSSYSTTNEVTGTGYTAGGLTVASPTVTGASGILTYDAADLSWTSSTITAHGAVIYADGLTPKANIVAVNFGADFSTTSGTFQITWNAGGIFTIDLVP